MHYQHYSDIIHKTKPFCILETHGMFLLLPAFVPMGKIFLSTDFGKYSLSPSEGHLRMFECKIMTNRGFIRYVFAKSGDAN